MKIKNYRDTASRYAKTFKDDPLRLDAFLFGIEMLASTDLEIDIIEYGALLLFAHALQGEHDIIRRLLEEGAFPAQSFSLYDEWSGNASEDTHVEEVRK